MKRRMQTGMIEATSGTKVQKRSFLLIIYICAGFLLLGCTTDPVPDEAFEVPAGNFPLLGTVPDRPPFQSLADTVRQQRRLQHDHHEAREKQADIIQSIAS